MQSLALALLQTWEQLIDPLDVVGVPVAAQIRAHVEVLANRHSREAVAPLGGR
jgi:hypothetical protein